jgi:serine/threonine-protein kinase
MPIPTLDAAQGTIAFEVLAEIAVGDSARVDLCRLRQPASRAGELVAVKRLHAHVADDPTFIKQFHDEVRITHWLHHPNVVEVAGWGTDDEGSYLAVELVQGVSVLRLMKTVFETGEAFNERMVVYVGSRICRGLAAAHSLRAPDGELLHLVHRDLTPGNVLVGFNGEVKITDFGMAKATQRLTQTLTGMRKGEPTYMAPEQAQSDKVDARADLFSLGVMLFELFAGRRPWIAKNDLQMLQITARDPPADLFELRPRIDPQLVGVVNRCLERDPDARWQSADEIASRLDEWLALHGYQEGNEEALARFVRRNAMRQMRWFERAVAGALAPEKVQREMPPRVPTYTEHSKLPDPSRSLSAPSLDAPSLDAPSLDVPSLDAPSRSAPSRSAPSRSAPGHVNMPTPPPPRPTGPTGRPAPPRPADPRAARAANVVQQLKKLAPSPEPRRPAGNARRRLPTLDEGEETDVQLRAPTGNLQTLASLVPVGEDGEDEENGEEVPTLVQKDDPKIAALRAQVRALPRGNAGGGRATASAAPVSLVAEEEGDDRTTNVQKELKETTPASPAVSLASVLPGLPKLPSLVGDDEGDAPTKPRSRGEAGPLVPAPPAVGPRAAHVVPRVIPASPDVPQRPFVPVVPGLPRVPSAREPRPSHMQPPAPTPASASVTGDDDAEVIDRAALVSAEHARVLAAVDREAILAEADRFAIEAVRCSEEARAAQTRAERKAVAARVAGDAATIAAEAVRILSSGNIAGAMARMDDARAAARGEAVRPAVEPSQAPAQPANSPSVAPPAPSRAPPSLAPPPLSVAPVPAPAPPVFAGAASHGAPQPVPPQPVPMQPVAAPPVAVARVAPEPIAAPPQPIRMPSAAELDEIATSMKPSFLGMGAAAGGVVVAGALLLVVVLLAVLGK